MTKSKAKARRRPRLRVVANGMRDIVCPRCRSPRRIVQVDWAPVEWPVVGVRANGNVVVDNRGHRYRVDLERTGSQELRCRECGFSWPLPRDTRIECTADGR